MNSYFNIRLLALSVEGVIFILQINGIREVLQKSYKYISIPLSSHINQ